MPPRIPGTFSNGVMSLKFMQRAMAAEQKPVQAEAAEIIDDSKWVIARSPEEEALQSTPVHQGFEVTYEPSYIPFIFEKSNENTTSAKPIKGRRVFGSGTDAQGDMEDEKPIKREYSPIPTKKEEDTMQSDEELDYGSATFTDSKPMQIPSRNPVASTSAPIASTSSTATTQPVNQFLRPSVDVPKSKPAKQPGSGTSKRDLLTAMIANSRTSKAILTESTPTNDESGGSTPAFVPLDETKGTRRKAADDGDRPRKKAKKQKVPNPA